MADLSGGVGKESYKFTATSFKKSSYEKELFELVQLSEVPLDHELFKVILELLKENVAPSAIVQVLKALRSAAASEFSAASKQPSRTESPEPLMEF